MTQTEIIISIVWKVDTNTPVIFGPEDEDITL